MPTLSPSFRAGAAPAAPFVAHVCTWVGDTAASVPVGQEAVRGTDYVRARSLNTEVAVGVGVRDQGGTDTTGLGRNDRFMGFCSVHVRWRQPRCCSDNCACRLARRHVASGHQQLPASAGCLVLVLDSCPCILCRPSCRCRLQHCTHSARWAGGLV